MKASEIDRELQEADPASSGHMAGLELGPAEAALGEAIVAGPGTDSTSDSGAMPWPSAARRRRRGLFGLAGLGAAAAVAALLILGGGASESPQSAYGADLVRFAETSPLLLLKGPGWRVQNAEENRSREGIEGSMEFITGKPIPNESIQLSANGISGMSPPSVRQRKVELSWRHGKLSFPAPVHPTISLPVLETTASVNMKAGEISVTTKSGKRIFNQGRPGDRTMAAIWREGNLVVEMRAAVPDLEAFEERLGWLAKVDSQTWLDAMPAKVVKASDHNATVREMLKGVPVPSTFNPSRVPDEGLTTDRYQAGAAVTGTVSCLWFRQWGEARRTDDRAAAAEAERAMATSKHWSILREMAKEGDYPEVVWALAAAMPKGYWKWNGHRQNLLAHAEGLNCARDGLPVLPQKMKLQRERGVPPPPR